MNIKFFALIIVISIFSCSDRQIGNAKDNLDKKVKSFIEKEKNNWADWNVPIEDGKTLYNIIVKNKYTRALEIGTSTGHSTIWIAWAMSKTGGKVTTLEIDNGRHNQAVDNFIKAGVSKYIDARLGDAHQLVKQLKGSYDFIFCDADKDWYTKYFKILNPKLKVGGVYIAHNAIEPDFKAIKDFIQYIQSLKNYNTSIDRGSSAGMSISYKTSE